MKYGIYSINDAVTGFINISIDVNDSSAKRNFGHACKNPDSLFFSHSSDYSLYKVGVFDTETGIIESFPVIQKMVGADQLIRKE